MMHPRDICPEIIISALPEDERGQGNRIKGSLQQLSEYAIDFRSAIELLEYSRCEHALLREIERKTMPFSRAKERESLTRWQSIAARDGGMTIYHFLRTMEGIRDALHLCPTFHAIIDRRALGAAIKRFKQQFPFAERLRHAVAHDADKREKPDRFKENPLEGPFLGMGIDMDENSSDYIIGFFENKFVTMFEGSVVSYEPSRKSVDVINSVKTEFFDAFRPAEDLTNPNRHLAPWNRDC